MRTANRILRALPKTPRLTQARAGQRHRAAGSLENVPVRRSAAPASAPPVVTSSIMIVPAGSRIQDVSAGGSQMIGRMVGIGGLSAARHGSCVAAVFLEKDSHSPRESLNFFLCRTRVVRERATLGSDFVLQGVRGRKVARTTGWNQGAARSGNRKRTRVRVACGGSIRPRGLGRQPIHGHLGLSVVGGEISSPVVLQPACELRVRQRHFSRGPGLLAALKRGFRSVACGACVSARSAPRTAAGEQWAAGATRPGGCNVIRAASLPTCPPERPAAGRGAQPTGPRTRLRNA